MKIKNFKYFILFFLLFLTGFLTITMNLILFPPSRNLFWEESKKFKMKMPHTSFTNIWTSGGVAICTESNNQELPSWSERSICSDGTGGAIIAWMDRRNYGSTYYDIYIQRINSTGKTQWTANGTAVCTEDFSQTTMDICSDGASGAFIAWKDGRNGVHGDIYAQHINSTGDMQWTPNGTPVCTTNDDQTTPTICSDGLGGAIIVWCDDRDYPSTYYDIYAQRIDSNGIKQWSADGEIVCTANYNQYWPKICDDGVGGAIISWQHFRTDYFFCIYAQRLNSNGTRQWSPDNGVVICLVDNDQEFPLICSDGANGAYLTWEDNRGSDKDIYVQRINSNGISQWTANGKVICTAENDQERPRIFNNGMGGVYLTWEDNRDPDKKIYSQCIDSNGDIQWLVDGVNIFTPSSDQDKHQICSDDIGGMIIAWEDSRSGTNTDIYAQSIKNEAPYSNHPGLIITSTDGSETIGWKLYDDCGEGYYHVMVNTTSGGFYQWVSLTQWTNNTLLNVPINRTMLGKYNYTIEYCDKHFQFGLPDSVLVTIESAPKNGEDDDGEDGDGEDGDGEEDGGEVAIPGYNGFILIVAISIFSVVVIKRRWKNPYNLH